MQQDDERTPEAIALLIQNGDKSLILLLWEKVQRFVYRFAGSWHRWLQNERPQTATVVDTEDLIQSGFLAMMQAVKTFDPEHGSFINYLARHLKTAFRAAYCDGHTRKNEAGLVAVSGDAIIGSDPDNSITLFDLLPDSQAALPFAAILDKSEAGTLLRQIHAIADELLIGPQHDIFLRHVLEGVSITALAVEYGMPPGSASFAYQEALSWIRLHPTIRALEQTTPSVSDQKFRCAPAERYVEAVERKKTIDCNLQRRYKQRKLFVARKRMQTAATMRQAEK